MTFRSTTTVAVLASWFLLFAPCVGSAQNADAAEVQRYILTDAKLGQYEQATENLAALGCENANEDEDDVQSLDGMVAAFSATPGAEDAVRSAGMTPREFVVFSMSLLQNGLVALVASQPGAALPPGVSRANIDFITRNNTRLQALEQTQESCGDELDDEVEEPEAEEE